MKRINKEIVKKALGILVDNGVLAKGRSDSMKVFNLDKDFLTICNAFTFNVFNLGLEQAVFQLENHSDKKHKTFSGILLQYIAATEGYKLLSIYLEEKLATEEEFIKHQIVQAVEYLKLSMQIGINPNHSKKSKYVQ